MRFEGKISKLELNYGAYTKTLREGMERQVRQAARAWLLTAWLRVPVWSGQARGSLKNAGGSFGFLARYLRVQVVINPVKTRPNKNEGTGSRFSSYTFKSTKYTFSFSYRNILNYFTDPSFGQESNPGVSPDAPWKALESANDSYRRYMDENLAARIPKIRDFLVVTKNG